MRMFVLAFAGAVALAGCSPRVPVGTPSARIAEAIDLGKLSPDAQLDVVVGVTLPHAAALGKFLSEQPTTRDVMTPIDFADRFAVSSGQYAQLVTWLAGNGLIVTHVSDGRTSISVHGTAENFERAFGANLHRFSDDGGDFVAAVDGWSLAPDIAPSVSGVIGLDGALAWKTHFTLVPQAGNPNPGSGGEMAPDIEKLYNTTNIATPGSGETIVILGAGLAPAQSDVSSYVSNNKPYGLTAMKGTYTVEQVGGANRDPMMIAQEEQQENTLDVEMVAAIAPYANVIHVLTATNTPGLFADGIAYIINKHASVHQVSVSYGTCERGAAGVMPVMNAMFQQALAEGQTWFFAAGDTGSDACRDGTTNKIVSAGYPASSPYVIGVGGTQLDSSGNETTWNNWSGSDLIKGAGGGGPSESQDKPAYQMNVTPNDGSRDTPDVAALAGPPFVNIQVMGTSAPVAGTSAAAPMWASVWALLEQAKKDATIPNLHARLYQLGAANAMAAQKSFNDINDSSNNGGPNDGAMGGYPAGPGFDLATGWGSPNVPNLIANW